MTIVQLIYNMTFSDTGQILVCAPSNAACNLLARRLHEAGISVLRYFSSSREAADSGAMPSATPIESFFLSKSNFSKYRTLKSQTGQLTDRDQRRYIKLQRDESREAIRMAKVVVCTCSVSGNTIMTGLRFDRFVIDEAGQAVLTEEVVKPRALLSVPRVI